MRNPFREDHLDSNKLMSKTNLLWVPIPRKTSSVQKVALLSKGEADMTSEDLLDCRYPSMEIWKFTAIRFLQFYFCKTFKVEWNALTWEQIHFNSLQGEVVKKVHVCMWRVDWRGLHKTDADDMTAIEKTFGTLKPSYVGQDYLHLWFSFKKSKHTRRAQKYDSLI